MGLIRRISNAIEQASTCDDCGHSNPAGVSGCNCSRSDCVC